MNKVHPSAVLDGDISLEDDVEIGPGCVLRGTVRIGRRTRLIGQCWVEGPISIGERNVIYPMACLGLAPQHTKFDPAKDGSGCAIGDGNTFREGFTMHRAFNDDHPTTIGDGNYCMTNAHVGHDCHVGDRVTLVTGAVLGGHAIVEDLVTIGGNTAVHQHCRIGQGAMLSGGVASSVDVPPWFMLSGINVVAGVNLIGLRRNGFAQEQIETIRWVYRVMNREGLSRPSIVARLGERAGDKVVDMYIAFIESSSRGVAASRFQPRRGSG